MGRRGRAPSLRPAVSVIVVADHPSDGLAPTLASVVAQTFINTEIIVVTRGPADIANIEAIPPFHLNRIRCVTEQRNATQGAARNAGILASRGQFIACLDAGDTWRPDCLERQVALLNADPDCGVVYAEAAVDCDRSAPRSPDRVIGAVTLLDLVKQSVAIALPTLVARREPLFDAGLFDDSLRWGDDFELSLRLAFRGVRMRHLPLVLAERRPRTDDSIGSAVLDVERTLGVLDRFGRTHRLDAATRTALRIRMMTLVDKLEIEQAKCRVAEGNFAAAEYHLRASRARPMSIRLALVALRVAPRLARAAFLRMRRRSTRRVLTAARSTA